MSTHPNSIAALDEPKMSRRAEAIYQFLRNNGPATDRIIKDGMRFPDMNCVRPRVTELIQCGRVVEMCDAFCPITGKTVRVVRATTALERIEANRQKEFQL